MPITDWPQEDRPREKLLNKGERTLTDAELIAIFLKTGLPGKTALDIAKELLVVHGGLKNLLHTSKQALINTRGIGQAKYAAIRAGLELGRRYSAENIPIRTTLDHPRKTLAFLATHMQHHINEVFACIYLDTHLRLISFEELFHGTVNSANIYPREIVRRGLYHNAAKVILAHNHPSGHSQPSQADEEVTRHIQHALALVDIEVIDHVIIGNPNHFSFAEMGLIR
jgi:DNA repair protein RadC